MVFPYIPMKPAGRRLAVFLLALCLTACETGAEDIGISPPPTDGPPIAAETRASTPTPAFPPTIAPSLTATPSPSRTVSTTPSVFPRIEIIPSSAPVSSTAPCQNVLYPIATGRRWKYALMRGEAENAAVVSVGDVGGGAASVNLLDQSTGGQSDFTVNCSEGALSGFSEAEIGFLFFSSGASLKTRSSSGLLAPSQCLLEEKDWQYSWTTGLTASGELNLDDPYLGEIELVFQDAPGQIEWQTAGAGENAFEAVETRARIFPHALKVEGKARFDLIVNVRMESRVQSLPAVLELVSTLWYEPRVGLVKQAFTSSQVIVGRYSCPANIASRMELLEYNFSA